MWNLFCQFPYGTKLSPDCLGKSIKGSCVSHSLSLTLSLFLILSHFLSLSHPPSSPSLYFSVLTLIFTSSSPSQLLSLPFFDRVKGQIPCTCPCLKYLPVEPEGTVTQSGQCPSFFEFSVSPCFFVTCLKKEHTKKAHFLSEQNQTAV